jgi:5,5'-dehydrodivanillate O-demethylase oxygenase subunit
MYYKTTKEQNEILTRVGRSTPMGELLRRYWWPVGFSDDLKDKPTFVRLMGEDLVLFRDGTGKPGVLAALCAHRRANLCLGNVEREGLRCRYHGWLYDTTGKILQTPGEPRDSKLKDSVEHPGYPTQELGGLVFTYIGPQPIPLLPRFHFLAADGERDILIQAFNNSNWLQNVENGIDPFHVSFLHGDVWTPMAVEPEKITFEETDWSVIYKALRSGRKEGEYNYREHHIIMPAIASGGDPSVSFGDDQSEASRLHPVTCRWSVPIDDTHTMNVRIRFRPPGMRQERKLRGYTNPLAAAQPESRWGITRPPAIEPYKEYRESDSATLGYTIPSTTAQEDAMMLDSLGPIVDRENENLSVIDEGITLLRDCYLRQIDVLKAGRDPKGVVRNEKENQLIVVGGIYRWIGAAERKEIQAAAAS